MQILFKKMELEQKFMLVNILQIYIKKDLILKRNQFYLFKNSIEKIIIQ
jgi:hypothetical protein